MRPVRATSLQICASTWEGITEEGSAQPRFAHAVRIRHGDGVPFLGRRRRALGIGPIVAARPGPPPVEGEVVAGNISEAAPAAGWARAFGERSVTSIVVVFGASRAVGRLTTHRSVHGTFGE